MSTIADLIAFLEEIAPPALAEDWDNVGLLVGDRARPARKVMTCLTVTPPTAAEAIAAGTDLIVSHHPLPFRPVSRLTVDDPAGRLLWNLAGAHVSVYSPHTAYDSAVEGINQQLATRLGVPDSQPLIPRVSGPGAGRFGNLPKAESLSTILGRIKTSLATPQVQFVGDPNRSIGRIGFACGSGGEFLEPAIAAGCDCLVTGEARFHTCLEAEAAGIALILAGHYATERFAQEVLADRLASRFPQVVIWASREERDPIRSA